MDDREQARELVLSQVLDLLALALGFGFLDGGGGRSSSGSRMSSFGGMGSGSRPAGISKSMS